VLRPSKHERRTLICCYSPLVSHILIYQESKAKVVQVSRGTDVVTVVIQVSSLFSEPLAPGALYLLDNPEKKIIELHRLKAARGTVLTYETYDHVGDVPNLGAEYICQVWWTPNQLEAVKDTSRSWTYEKYPDNGDHDHCLLTWETIAADAQHKAGYRSGKDWITEEAHKTYIVEDKLRVRNQTGKRDKSN
jgi:hypothetical protein